MNKRKSDNDLEALHSLVLNSMSESLAVLDPHGKIVAVNGSWEAFAAENGPVDLKHVGVGANYLEVCQRAAREDPSAAAVLDALQSVLDGSLDIFREEYPCHSPTEERYFCMSATPMQNGHGAIVLHTDVTDLIRVQRELEATLQEVERLRKQVQLENEYLQEEIKVNHGFDEIVGDSDALTRSLRQVEMVAKTNSTVLLHGETGTGKELFARAIHSYSERADRPMVKIDCGALPEGLIESELFGHEKGAFTGAHKAKAGRFEIAHEGTIFLDEIGELSSGLQTRLLRVLEDHEICRIGSSDYRTVDVRVIAATNRDLTELIREGRFREDLYYRLCVFPIEIPPLRERRQDIIPLVMFFLSRFARETKKNIRSASPASLSALERYDWPGNVRELRNIIERSVILCQGETLDVTPSLAQSPIDQPQSEDSLKQDLGAIERGRILRALEDSNWKIKGQDSAASRLGLAPSTLRSKMKKYGIGRS